VAALAILLLANPFGSTPIPRAASERDASVVSVAANSTSAPKLTIHLPDFPPEGTTNTTLDASWGSAPSGCTLHPEWAEWFLPSAAAAGGFFSSPDVARTLFVPSDLTSGTSEVGVRSDTEVSCEGLNQTVEGVAFSNVTTYPALTLTDLSVDPSATSVPGRVLLSGQAGGGRPPYLLGVEWGDGSFLNRTLTEAGGFAVPHTFGPGTFRPRVGVYDSDRIDTRGVVPEPVEVSNGTVLAINASLPLAEVGVPVGFQGSVDRPVAHYGAAIACGTDPIVLPAYYITNVTCTPTAPGTLAVTFKVGAPVPTLVAQVTREESVAPALAVTVRPLPSPLDAGTQTYVRVTITGGVPPFWVTCGSWNGTLSRVSDAPADGSFLVAWTPPFAGAAVLNGSATDSLGASVTSPWLKLVVNAPPSLTLQSNVTIDVRATTVAFHAGVVGGSAPLFWGVETDPVPSASTPLFGANFNGSIGWSCTFFEEGVATFVLQLEDPAGTVLTRNVTIDLPAAPSLGVRSLPHNSTGPTVLHLAITADGGVMPFSLWVNSSGSTLWNGSEPAPGPYLVSLSLGRPGLVDLSVALVDARGVRAVVNLTLIVPVLPERGSAGGIGSGFDLVPWVAGAIIVLLAGGIGGVRWRSRTRTPEVAPPDPESLLERLLRPADGADRLTIELMAEEEGVSLDTVRETLDRLIREGRVRAESDPNGGEVLAWSTG